MNVFSDKHHQGLTKSLQMLFEGRLKSKLYTPIGIEWYPEFWKLNDIEATAKQFLENGSQPYPEYSPLTHDRPITLEDFKNTKFDILIASVPQHIEPFKDLIRRYQPEAKLIFQIGNAWNIPNNSVRNVMASAICLPPIQVNYIEYHQEFDLNIFHQEPIPMNKKIYSFINCLNTVDIYKKDWELFLELEKLMPDWEFKSFGGQCRDGSFATTQEVADKMREADFIFMCKTEGDGYGHNIFNAAAVGRPIITRLADYKGKLAEPLITHHSSVIVDGRNPQDIAEQIEALDYFNGSADILNSSLNSFKMGLNIYRLFKEHVNFEEEVKEIKKFIDRLI